MLCTKCGQENSREDKFCGGCGSPIIESSFKSILQEFKEIEEAYAEIRIKKNHRRKVIKRTILIFLLSCILLVVGFVIVRKVTWTNIQGTVKDVDDLLQFRIKNVKEIVDVSSNIQRFYGKNDVLLAEIEYEESFVSFDYTYVSSVNVYDQCGNIISRLGIYRDLGEIYAEWYEYEYNKNKDITREKHYGKDGKLDYYTDYIYNKDGEIKKEIRYDKSNIYVPLIITYTYKYDRGKIIKKTKKRTDDYYVTDYDKNGNIIRYDGYIDGYKCKYDENNNCISKTFLKGYKEQRLVDSIQEYLYDEDNNMIRCNYYDKEGMLISYVRYTYDENNNLVLKQFYDKKDIIYDTRFIRYEYDGDVKIKLKKKKYTDEYDDCVIKYLAIITYE